MRALVERNLQKQKEEDDKGKKCVVREYAGGNRKNTGIYRREGVNWECEQRMTGNILVMYNKGNMRYAWGGTES